VKRAGTRGQRRRGFLAGLRARFFALLRPPFLAERLAVFFFAAFFFAAFLVPLRADFRALFLAARRAGRFAAFLADFLGVRLAFLAAFFLRGLRWGAAARVGEGAGGVLVES
jgi:hypothetical protein